MENRKVVPTATVAIMKAKAKKDVKRKTEWDLFYLMTGWHSERVSKPDKRKR